MFPTPFLIVLVALLATSAATDLIRRVVPNWATVALAVTGIAAQASTGGWRAAALAAAVALVLGVLMLAPWSRGLVGGGDLKLAVGAAAWTGVDHSVTFVLASAVAGGLLALPFLRSLAGFARGLLVSYAQRRVGAGAVARHHERRVPFAVAIAIGALVAVSIG